MDHSRDCLARDTGGAARPRAATLAGLVLGLLAAAASAPAESLKGTELRPISETESGLGGILVDLLSRKGGPPLTVSRVLVTEDSPSRLALLLSVAGDSLEGLRFEGEMRGADRRRLRGIRGPAVEPKGGGQFELRFELDPGVAPEATGESVSLRLSGTRAGKTFPAFFATYALAKAWGVGAGSSSSAVHRCQPQPIGAAARLGGTPTWDRPTRVLVPAKTMVAVPLSPAVETRRIRPDVARRVGGAARPGAGVVTDATGAVVPGAAPPQAATPAVRALPKAAYLEAARFQWGVKQEDKDKGAGGPGGSAIDLLEGLVVEDIGIELDDVTSLFHQVYQDKNPASGVFYFRPRQYDLAWTAEDGHALRILFGTATTEGQAGQVFMAARLATGVDASEIQLARDLLEAYKKRHTGTVYTSLSPLPIDAVQVSLADRLRQFDIPPEKVAITAISDVLGGVDATWATDPVTTDNFKLALVEDVGIGGEVAFTPTGGGLGVQQVPLRLALADGRTFGRMRWRRGEAWTNSTPYPLRLRYLHALVVEPASGTPIVYSWDLKGLEVKPQSQVEWDATTVPAWVDSHAKRMWIDFRPVASCAECDQSVMKGITGATVAVSQSLITFHTITPLADLGAYELTVQVRSKYFDPRERQLQTKTLALSADNRDFTVGPVYLVDRQDGQTTPGDPLFEYRIDLTKSDGSSYSGSRFIPSDRVRVLVGRSQVQQSIETLPPPEAPTPSPADPPPPAEPPPPPPPGS